jgi:hypothetical protein
VHERAAASAIVIGTPSISPISMDPTSMLDVVC